jgi:hypothetical protein
MTTERKPENQTSSYEHLVGATALTSEGEPLGTVKETHGSYLFVDAPRHRDYWLSTEHISGTTRERVTFCFSKGELDQYELKEPGLEPWEDPFREIVEDSIVSPDEQLEQRVRMERELAEQRRRLPHEHEDGEESPPQTGGALGTVGEPVESELPRIEARLESEPSPQPASISSERDPRSYTGAIVPPADRVSATGNKPITEDTPSRDRQPAAPPSLLHDEAQPEARERWIAPEYAGAQPQPRERSVAPEYAGNYGDVEMPEGPNPRTMVIAALGVISVVALVLYRRRRSRRRRFGILPD